MEMLKVVARIQTYILTHYGVNNTPRQLKKEHHKQQYSSTASATTTTKTHTLPVKALK